MASAASEVVAAVEAFVEFAAEEHLTAFLAFLVVAASQVVEEFQAAAACQVVVAVVAFLQFAVVAVGLAVAAGKDNCTLTDDNTQPIERNSPVLYW